MAGNADARLKILKIDGEGQSGPIQMGGDLAVSFPLAGHLAGEAFQGPDVAGCRTFDFIDVGEVAGPKHRQPSIVELPRGRPSSSSSPMHERRFWTASK